MAKILLVDDEPRIARVVRDMVEGADWQFAYADNGADALDAVARETPDLIIMDVMMPKMDGYAATRQIRTLPSDVANVPIVAMTANAFAEDEVKSREVGMNAHISKPVDMKTLEKTIRSIKSGGGGGYRNAGHCSVTIK